MCNANRVITAGKLTSGLNFASVGFAKMYVWLLALLELIYGTSIAVYQ